MCRCNPQIRSPYCNRCNDLMPKANVQREGTKLFDILMDGWQRGFDQYEVLLSAQSAGYILTSGEVEISFIIFDEQLNRSMGG